MPEKPLTIALLSVYCPRIIAEHDRRASSSLVDDAHKCCRSIRADRNCFAFGYLARTSPEDSVSFAFSLRRSHPQLGCHLVEYSFVCVPLLDCLPACQQHRTPGAGFHHWMGCSLTAFSVE